MDPCACAAAGRYRCPLDATPYCSVPCYKLHLLTSLHLSPSLPPPPPTSVLRALPSLNWSSALPPAHLLAIATHPPLRQLLTPELIVLLTRLESLSNPLQKEQNLRLWLGFNPISLKNYYRPSSIAFNRSEAPKVFIPRKETRGGVETWLEITSREQELILEFAEKLRQVMENVGPVVLLEQGEEEDY